MADLYRVQHSGVPSDMESLYEEVGLGCHGLTVATSEVWAMDEGAGVVTAPTVTGANVGNMTDCVWWPCADEADPIPM